MLATRLLAAVRLAASGRVEEGAERLQSCIEVERRRRAGREHGVEHLGGHGVPDGAVGALEVVGAQSLEDIVVYFSRDARGRQRRRLAGGGRRLPDILAHPRHGAREQPATDPARAASRSGSACTPIAARRSPNGSFVPVGFSPMANMPAERIKLVGNRQRSAGLRWPAAHRRRRAAGSVPGWRWRLRRSSPSARA